MTKLKTFHGVSFLAYLILISWSLEYPVDHEIEEFSKVTLLHLNGTCITYRRGKRVLAERWDSGHCKYINIYESCGSFTFYDYDENGNLVSCNHGLGCSSSTISFHGKVGYNIIYMEILLLGNNILKKSLI
jgi:hypothetical protein